MRRVGLAGLLVLTGCEFVGGFQEFRGSDGSGGSPSNLGGGAGVAGSSTAGTGGAVTTGGAAGMAGGAAGQAGAAGGSAGTTGGGQAGAANPCAGKTSTGKAGAPMVGHAMPAGDCVFIDKQEVSAADYAEFLKVASVTAQGTLCKSINADFGPEPACMVGVATDPQLPAVCVDQCDAQAFCAFAGKFLCPGESGNPTAATDAWYQACSMNGATTYSYAGAYDAKRCNSTEKTTAGMKPLPVGGQTSCATADGALDLSGNVAEWTAACNDNIGVGDLCSVRGGAFNDGASALTCASNLPRMRSTRDASIGFRCCASPM